jgi:hypothetical protein
MIRSIVTVSKVSQVDRIAGEARTRITGMKVSWQTGVVIALFSAAIMIARAQFSTTVPSLAEEPQARGYWVDPSTGLMWAGKDNGEDVNWHKASEYCSNLRLAGYSDWRLATIEELREIYAWNASAPGELPRSSEHEAFVYTFDIKGNIFLTGDPWSGSRIDDDPAHPPKYGWYLNFNRPGKTYGELSAVLGKRALCMRSSTVISPPPPTRPATANGQSSTDDAELEKETEAHQYWVDPSTGLMWPWRDNGKEVTWHEAVSYCRNLRLAGFSDWRLATLDELASLVDQNAPAPKRVGNMKTFSINVGRHVKGDLLLKGDPWSSNREKDRFGHSYGDGWFFDFVKSQPSFDLPYFRNAKYALCVRRSGK